MVVTVPSIVTGPGLPNTSQSLLVGQLGAQLNLDMPPTLASLSPAGVRDTFSSLSFLVFSHLPTLSHLLRAFLETEEFGFAKNIGAKVLMANRFHVNQRVHMVGGDTMNPT